MTALLPKYKCKFIAQQVSILLNLSPALEWWQVKDYYAPRLSGMAFVAESRYDDETRQAIMRRLDVEYRYHHSIVP